MAELREDVAVMGMKLSFLDEVVLKRYAAAIDSFYCRMCAECEPTCPRGVGISTINRALMYRRRTGAVNWRARHTGKSLLRALPKPASNAAPVPPDAATGSISRLR